MAARVRPWLLDHLPPSILDLSAEWFLAIACILSGQAIVTGIGRTKSVAMLLYPPMYYAWGGCLLFGGVAIVLGLSSIRRLSTHRYVITRPAIYLLGLRLLGIASIVYAIAVLIVAGRTGLLAAGITLAFAGMCGVRVLVVGGRDE